MRNEFLILGSEKVLRETFCEVEFWEVLRFLRMCKGVYNGGAPFFPPAGCQLANLEGL